MKLNKVFKAFTTSALILFFAGNGFAMGPMNTNSTTGSSSQMATGMNMGNDPMPMNGHFNKTMTKGDIKANFSIMSFASMNMAPVDGETHHIMLEITPKNSGEKIKKVVGKVQVVFPDGSKKVRTLTDYSGSYSANYSFKKGEKYGVMTLVKVNGETHSFKFWYTAGM